MDKGDYGLTVLSLVLLSVCGVFGIPSTSFLMYKALKKPRVFLRFSSTFVLAALGLVACFVLVPVKVIEIVRGYMVERTTTSLCTPVLSIKGFLEISQMISLCVLTVNRSRNVQSLKRHKYLTTEAVSVCVGLAVGIGCCLLIGAGQYDGGIWDETSLVCTVSVNTVKMTHVSVFYMIRFVVLVVTCMAMLGSWISMLMFLRAPKVAPFRTRCATGNVRPQIELIFDEEFQRQGMEGIYQQGDETHSAEMPNIQENMDHTLERCPSIGDFSNYLPTSRFYSHTRRALSNLRTDSGLAFSDICNPGHFDVDAGSRQLNSHSPLSLPTYLINSTLNSMHSASSSPKKSKRLIWKRSQDHSVRSLSMLSLDPQHYLSRTCSFDEHVNDVHEHRSSEVKTEPCNDADRPLGLSVEVCFNIQDNLNLDHDSGVCGPGSLRKNTVVRRFLSLDSDGSADIHLATQDRVLATLCYMGEECESHNADENNTDDNTCVTMAYSPPLNNLDSYALSPSPRPVRFRITSDSTDNDSARIISVSESCCDHVEDTQRSKGGVANEVEQDDVVSNTLSRPVDNSSFGLSPPTPARTDSDFISSPGMSSATEFSFVSRRLQHMKKVMRKPLLEILVVLLLLLPDYVIKCLSFFDIHGDATALSPLTESLSLLLFAVNPFMFIINNRTIMDAL